MKRTEKKFGRGLTLMGGVLGVWCLILGCLPASGANPSYVNNAIVAYPGTLTAPPEIDAVTFVNNSVFAINFSEMDIALYFETGLPLYYETSDTLNFTNNYVMESDTGYQFDNQSSSDMGLRTPAANFDNSGSITNGSVADLGDVISGLLIDLGSYPACIVNATNIVNPGVVDVGNGGLIQFTGQNIDLYKGVLNIEGGGGSAGGNSVFDLNTNYWDPYAALGGTFTLSGQQIFQSAFFPMAPYELDLAGATSYINQAVGAGGTNIVRAVFILDTSASNVSVNVHFDSANLQLGNGSVTIQWAGSYLDPASGNIVSNYLYLNNDYVGGASTNILPLPPGGLPGSMTITESTTPEIFNTAPAPAGFESVFNPDGSITNYQLFADLQLLASPSTNGIADQANSNLTSRVEISASSYLTLSNAQITGASYLNVQATNVFAGSGGALIQTPYADLNLGTTNGTLYLTNTMSASIPSWGGEIQAWNTRWIYTGNDVTTGLPVTNDYRVLIIASQVTPTILAQVNNLVLHDYASNNIVISDSFNVMNTFTADAASLTLTTNPPGYGATSLEGALNFESAAVFSLPNLRFLTNNGTIQTVNSANFSYEATTNYATNTYAASGSAASATLTELAGQASNVVPKDMVTIGTNKYVFVTTLTNKVPNQVAIVPSSFNGTISNLIAAINGTGASGAGKSFSTNTRANPSVTAGAWYDYSFTVTARQPGANGNSIVTTFTPATTATNLSWNGQTTLTGGGVMYVTNIMSFLNNSAFINNGVVRDEGSTIYASTFESSGIIDNGLAGNFYLDSLTTTLTNGVLSAGNSISITADSIVTSNLTLVAGGALTLQATNELTDSGLTNHNVWSVSANGTAEGSGFNLPIKPATGDLLGTTVTLTAPTGRTVASVWAGQDRGLSTAGYTNNEAVGRMIFDVGASATAGHNGVLAFNGASVSNALYVDLLILTNFASSGNGTNNYNFPWLQINNNMYVYFAQALANGVSVAEDIDNQSKLGANNGRLRWINTYTGYNSSTNFYYTNTFGVIYTNTVNAALAESHDIDSDSDGIPNYLDPTPFFVPPQLKFSAAVTNLPAASVRVKWVTIPNATNYIYYATNFPPAASDWLAFTNFGNYYYGNNVAVTNAAHGNSFLSPQVYINNASLPDNSQQTAVWLYDAVSSVPHYYKVTVWPNVDFAP